LFCPNENYFHTATIFRMRGLISEQKHRSNRLVMAHERLIRLLNFLWLLLVLPGTVAILVGFVSHSSTLGIKTFLLIEVGVAILSPLLTAILASRTPSQRNRGK
jgi:hypothetical protein